MNLSSILQRTDVIVTGRNLSLSCLEPPLRSGVIVPLFQIEGQVPTSSEILKILVIGILSTVAHSFRILGCIHSAIFDLLGSMLRRCFSTSSSVISTSSMSMPSSIP